MANGPPTPPPTTEAEIQDEARITAENLTATVPPPVTTQQDMFQAVFPTIVDLVSQSNFRGLIQVAESADINSDAESDRRVTRLLVLGPLVLAYLIVDDLPPARFVLTRLPEIISSTPLISSLAGLLASTWDRKHTNVYSRAQELYDLVNQPAFFHEQLAPVLTSLTSTFVESFRRRTIALLSTAYTSLPVSLAQEYLGMEEELLLTAAQNEGWSYDTLTNVLVPTAARPVATNNAEPATSSLSSFHFVADSVAKLEL